jgi:hypothetical protein
MEERAVCHKLDGHSEMLDELPVDLDKSMLLAGKCFRNC